MKEAHQVTDSFKIYCESSIEHWRKNTFSTKEVETILWIDSFWGGNFVDIGSNIGLYSLYCAAKHSEMVILAFEPFQKNYERLLENTQLNGFTNVVAANVAVGGFTGLFKLQFVSDEIGSSGHQLNDKEGVSCPCVTLDNFQILSKLPLNYIKIDTDGNEYDIIRNATTVLQHPETKSVLIEVNDHKEQILSIMRFHGFTMDNEFNKAENHSRIRREKEGIAAENIIFTRG